MDELHERTSGIKSVLLFVFVNVCILIIWPPTIVGAWTTGADG